MSNGRKTGEITNVNEPEERTFINETGTRNRYVQLASSPFGPGTPVTFEPTTAVDGLTNLPIAVNVQPVPVHSI